MGCTNTGARPDVAHKPHFPGSCTSPRWHGEGRLCSSFSLPPHAESKSQSHWSSFQNMSWIPCHHPSPSQHHLSLEPQKLPPNWNSHFHSCATQFSARAKTSVWELDYVFIPLPKTFEWLPITLWKKCKLLSVAHRASGPSSILGHFPLQP